MAVWQSREESPQTDDDRDDDQRFPEPAGIVTRHAGRWVRAATAQKSAAALVFRPARGAVPGL